MREAFDIVGFVCVSTTYEIDSVGFAGLCTNESCPYRHVNVNPKAPICEGFLQGYCADGDTVKTRISSLVLLLDHLFATCCTVKAVVELRLQTV